MLAFRIEVDGEEIAVAGVEDWAVLALHVTASRTDASEHPFGHSHVSVGGLALPGELPDTITSDGRTETFRSDRKW